MYLHQAQFPIPQTSHTGWTRHHLKDEYNMLAL